MNTISYLCQRAYDYPSCESGSRLDFMVATIPRSGSTYFTMELWRSGGFGAPMEYLNSLFIPLLGSEVDSEEGMESYWQSIRRRRTSKNGIFGYKMFMTNYVFLAKNYPLFLKNIAPQKVIYFTRSNIMEQAVSYAKAVQTNSWFGDAKLSEDPLYNYDRIEACERMIRSQMLFWEQVFELTGESVLRVRYEDTLESLPTVISRCAEFLGIDLQLVSPLDIPVLSVQRDASSADWLVRYKEESDYRKRSVA